MLLSEVGVFMSMINGILTSILSICGDLFMLVCFFFAGWIILATLKAAAYRHGG